ncbi:MAG: lipoyl(octanoyl) transferase LipB [Actinomycetota bacterium]|nr:lipoyl(octanoyl) transferase LipB [Actinomycetota bacterium]
MKTLSVVDAGVVPYVTALRWQKELHTRRVADEMGDVLLLLEHPHVYSLGRRFADQHLIASRQELAARGIEVHESDRGGSITYHGPGQLVAYPIIDLRRPDRDLPDTIKYLRILEEAIIRTVRAFGLISTRRESMTGVWVGDSKLAAIGVNISQGVSRHGLAINVTTDLSFFEGMIPCGLEGRSVTSLDSLGVPARMDQVKRQLSSELATLFHRVQVPLTKRELGIETKEPGAEIIALHRKSASA